MNQANPTLPDGLSLEPRKGLQPPHSRKKIEIFTKNNLKIAASIIAVAIGYYYLAGYLTQRKQRLPDPLEITYSVMSASMTSPELCNRIYPYAINDSLSSNPAGRRAYYYRSMCLTVVAATAKDPTLCSEVMAAPGGKNLVSEDICLADAASGKASFLAIRHTDVRPVLEKMGYTYKDTEGIESNDPWFDFFIKVAGTPEFRSRTSLLPDFTRAKTIETSTIE